MRSATIAAVAATLVLAGCATAPRSFDIPTGLAITMPPEPYLSLGRAALPGIPFVVMKDHEIRDVCGDGRACAILQADGGCTIVAAESVWQNTDIIEHEAAHCVGWAADHPGGNVIVTLIGG